MRKESQRSATKGKSNIRPNSGSWVTPESPEYARLTPTQKVFMNVYLQKLDASAAAVAAGYLSPHNVSGAEALRDPMIRKTIEAEMERFELGRDMTLYRLSQLARGGMGDFVVLDNSPQGFSFNFKEAIARGTFALVKSAVFNKGELVSLELHDTLPALAAILHFHGSY